MAKYQVMVCDEGGHGVAHWLLGNIAGRLPLRRTNAVLVSLPRTCRFATVDRGNRQLCQTKRLAHLRQKMCRAFHAGFQVEIERLFHGQSNEVDQWSILTNMCLLQCLDI